MTKVQEATWMLVAVVGFGCATPATRKAPESAASEAASASPQKIPVKSLDELPRHAYPIEGKVSALIQDDAAFAKFAEAVRHDLESDLAKYDIRDAATLRERYGTLSQLYLVTGDYDRALEYADKGQALEDKESLRLMHGQTTRAIAAAHAETGAGPGDSAFEASFRAHFAKALGALPWPVVGDIIQQTKGTMEIYGENLVLGIAQSQLDPMAARTGEVSGDAAPTVVNLYYGLHVALPLKDAIHSVCADLVAKNRVEKPDIWAARALTLGPSAGLDPVVVAVWDTGVDTSLYQGRLFVNPKEKLDGKDDDGNGFVDDVNGIAFDVTGHDSTALLHPLGDQAGKVEGALKSLKGLTDLQAAVDSPEAAALRSELSNLDPAAVGSTLESLGFVAGYAHGTHVAGIMTDGNPFARILVARISFDYHHVPVAVTEEVARRHADSYRRTAAYFRAHDVRR